MSPETDGIYYAKAEEEEAGNGGGGGGGGGGGVSEACQAKSVAAEAAQKVPFSPLKALFSS